MKHLKKWLMRSTCVLLLSVPALVDAQQESGEELAVESYMAVVSTFCRPAVSVS